MRFDEQLERSLGALSDRLRDDIARAVLAAGAEVAAHATEARDAAVQDASAHARAAAEATAHIEISRLELELQELTAVSASREQRRAADMAAGQRLVAAVRTIDRAASLSEVLDALVDCAGREATRVGLLLARAGELRGWRFAGFDPSATPARSILIPAEDSGVIAEAVRTGIAVVASGPAPAFAGLSGECESLAVPLLVNGDVAAVLYADQALNEEESLESATLRWSDTLELLARHAARCLEAATAIKAVRLLTDPPDIPESASSTELVSGARMSTRRDHQPQHELEHVELNT